MPSRLSSLWNQDGSTKGDAPRWASLRADMRTVFPTYYSTDPDPFAEMVGEAITYLNKLKPPGTPDSSPSSTPGYLIGDQVIGEPGNVSSPDYSNVNEARLGDTMMPVSDVLEQATLKYMGKEGFRSILGGILDIQHYFRDEVIVNEPTAVCVNDSDHGFVTLFRVYKTGVDAATQYQRELTDPAASAELAENNQLQKDIADLLWQWYRYGKPGDDYAPYISYTSGFRPTEYEDESIEPGFIYAVKSYPMNVNVTYEVMDDLMLVLEARDAIESGVVPDARDDAGNCPLPYSRYSEIDVVECDSEEGNTVGSATSDNLLSGIGRQSIKGLKRSRQRRKQK